MATKEPSTKKTLTPSEDALKAATNIPTESAGKTTLIGLPQGTKIKIGQETVSTPKNLTRPSRSKVNATFGEATYVEGDAEKIFSSKSAQDRAQLLLRLGQIPNLYPTGEAPTQEYVTRALTSGTIIPRTEDINAFKKILAASDLRGDIDPDTTVLSFLSNPKLSEQFFGKIAGTVKAVTPLAALEAEMNAKFLDLFETKADKKLIKAYAGEINALESTKAGITSQQKEDIFLKYTQQKANEVYDLTQTGTTPGGTDKGKLGTYVRNIRAAYAANGLPVNEKDLYTKAVQSLRSQDAYNNTINGIQQSAALIFPAFKDLIAQGKTAKEILSPYISLRANILEVPTDQIKVEDMYDVGSGKDAISIQDYKNKLYASNDYRKTNGFKERSLNDMQALLQAFRIG
jgi:hypothetical protein